ncbi:MAG: phosphoglucosamine mutase [Pseudomonadales bacterium]|nr:phosphoglucosamine mutase [Pseudomonadales bacterium]
MSKKYFGTDGIRGRVGEAPITAEFMLRLGWAAGRVFAKKGYSHILIGKDTRISGYMFESALEAGIISAGVNISMLGPMPTPAIAYLTRTFHAQAGIVISASHNPYYDNGIKFFSGEGKKLPDEIEFAIEAELENSLYTVESHALGKATRIPDAAGRYIEFCKSTAPAGIELNGLKLAVDCAHGATYHIAPSVFKELGATVRTMGVNPDGLNINENCGSTKPELLRQMVLEQGCDLGIAFDGDGDRVMMVDHKGETLDGDELIYIIADQRHRENRLRGGVVGTLMSNLGMELALKAMGIPFERAQVGDRYVLEQLVKQDWQLGGESSGHIICLDKVTTGDGIVAALQVLGAMSRSGKSLHALKQGMKKMPQTMVNVRLAQRGDPTQDPVVQKAVTHTEQKLGDQGRVLLRLSGTEPLVRVMVEGEDEALVCQLANDLAGSVQKAMS